MRTLTTNPQEMLALLESWVIRGWLRELDLALVRFFKTEVPAMDPVLMLVTALVSHQLGRGHVCLDLDNLLSDPCTVLSLPSDQNEPSARKEIQHISVLLADWKASGWLTQQTELISKDEKNTPLVLTGTRLYLRRYWRYERQVETAIYQRLISSQQIISQLPDIEFKDKLHALFPSTGTVYAQTDWQKIACALAARSAFSIITGGPGTGKTTTVVRLLALLQSIALIQNPERPLKICLAAPTGKAAARLKESIAGAIDKLPAFVQNDTALKTSIPSDVTTLHRLLGARPDSRLFRHDARHPLPLDVLVIDEGSMIDLEMMAAVLLALPSHARLIILGDKDQLASVEAGSVLGALCHRAQQGHFQPETAAWIEAIVGEKIDPVLLDADGLLLDQHIVMLRASWRFDAASGIGQLARAVNTGDPETIRTIWTQGYGDLCRHDLPDLEDKRLTAILLGQSGEKDAPQGVAGYLGTIKTERPPLDAEQAAFDAWAHQVLQSHGRFQLLCALRNGPFGVSGMNQHIETLLAKHQLIQPGNIWYEGRPVLVTCNDYALGLMNGDIGIALSYPMHNRTTGKLEWSTRVAFTRGNGSGGIHWVLPSRLLSIETVFALTVHKSQGSEFEHCALLLPPELNPVLTRELIYTGITRGKRWLSIICTDNNIIDQAVSRTLQRSGGLFAGSS
ncbi:DNA helicase/exodeoxyribonuclease V, alpha subunit [Nitrosomonas eutropha]|uniref:RecBCD enzyme subunit RecD n=1 Tax=Nitrosomonas eutropha TaxID=916 RepID=A0A1I7F786_9PROT|nr:exodeoxyribonuclease V subunit alpha [Nitrosomonas eutropha]SFU32047.1 DNA helicase/exodeoxyribonuclease V, alpha subunit [Nitrosomonas eutropha]